MLFIPENIFESKEFSKPMLVSLNCFNQQIDPLLYKSERAPADEIEMQRERWYEDFIEGGTPGGNQGADVTLKTAVSTLAEPNEDEF